MVVGDRGSVVGDRQSSGSEASDWMRADLTKFLAIDSISASSGWVRVGSSFWVGSFLIGSEQLGDRTWLVFGLGNSGFFKRCNSSENADFGFRCFPLSEYDGVYFE